MEKSFSGDAYFGWFILSPELLPEALPRTGGTCSQDGGREPPLYGGLGSCVRVRDRDLKETALISISVTQHAKGLGGCALRALSGSESHCLFTHFLMHSRSHLLAQSDFSLFGKGGLNSIVSDANLTPNRRHVVSALSAPAVRKNHS